MDKTNGGLQSSGLFSRQKLTEQQLKKAKRFADNRSKKALTDKEMKEANVTLPKGLRPA